MLDAAKVVALTEVVAMVDVAIVAPSIVPPSMSGVLMSPVFISGEVSILLVSVSDVANPTSVSLASVGKVMVMSAFGSIAKVVSKPSAAVPSNTSGVVPAMVPVTVTTSASASPSVTAPLRVVAPDTPSVPPTSSVLVGVMAMPTRLLAVSTMRSAEVSVMR